MEWDRAYGYAKYNDLGDPDQSKVLSLAPTTEDEYYKSFEEVQKLFKDKGNFHENVPSIIASGDLKAWMDDEEFEREMIAGVHPVHIRRIMVLFLFSFSFGINNFDFRTTPNSRQKLKDYGDQDSKTTMAHIEKILKKLKNDDGFTVKQAIKEKRLFILDHHDTFMPYLNDINDKKTCTRGYASRTILLFTKNEDDYPKLMPDGPKSNGAVQIAQYIPLQTKTKKTIINMLNTHAVIEPFVIATNRQLSVLHPIHKLLQPHYRGTMSINAYARNVLVNAGGGIKQLFFPRKYAMESSSNVYKNNWAFDKQGLPADLINMQVFLYETCIVYSSHC
ncbi:hypothetical protein F8388_000093 [Cannabis sativa]|uniref:Lipoxygenase domain-containing protein n=1 Tax=Cannabis sativa TaxID=3483 RepID=A0A7J6FMI2_CANSA|nr:hypothetical protein F8388_000093 [Cannabis sativa]